jgi:hypothetical protein
MIPYIQYAVANSGTQYTFNLETSFCDSSSELSRYNPAPNAMPRGNSKPAYLESSHLSLGPLNL